MGAPAICAEKCYKSRSVSWSFASAGTWLALAAPAIRSMSLAAVSPLLQADGDEGARPFVPGAVGCDWTPVAVAVADLSDSLGDQDALCAEVELLVARLQVVRRRRGGCRRVRLPRRPEDVPRRRRTSSSPTTSSPASTHSRPSSSAAPTNAPSASACTTSCWVMLALWRRVARRWRRRWKAPPGSIANVPRVFVVRRQRAISSRFHPLSFTAAGFRVDVHLTGWPSPGPAGRVDDAGENPGSDLRRAKR